VVAGAFKQVLDAVACFRPVAAFRTASGDVVFSARKGVESDLTLPCGQCIGCRVARARSWSLRCVHEAQQYSENCFVTLTYGPAHLPPGGSLQYRDFQLFMKRLRKRFSGREIRYFVCGEYGENLSRPHYHACLFNLDFPDKRPVSYLAKRPSWRSALLESLWGLGHTHLGELNASSAGYAARYVLKKVTGSAADLHYCRVDSDGVVCNLAPEFARMSLRPGLGARWLEQYRDDAYNFDHIVHNGAKYPVPKYYDRILEREDPERLSSIKEAREIRALPHRPECSPTRLAVRETVERARLSQLKREFECN